MRLRGAPLLALAAVLLRPAPARAVDVHSLFDAECRRTSGVLLHVDATHVALVDLEGRLVRTPREQVAVLVLHKLLESPLGSITLDPALAAYLRRIWVGADVEPTFTGWATAFAEDLVIFVDVDGRTHVLEPQDIRRMKPAAAVGARPTRRARTPPELGFPPEVVPCASEATDATALPPSYVIADRIKLGDLFSQLEEHYRALEGFEERTQVYAGPFVFDQASRVGLLWFEDMPLPIPFYFRFSTGRAYRFQSLLVIGNAVNEWLPITEPTISVRSDVKSHFFSASFVGNLAALPAGSDAFIVTDAVEGNFIDPSRITQVAVEPSYNYLMLLGADYWRLSLAGGPAYLATRIEVPNLERRTVLADRSSPTVRLRYQSDLLDGRVMYYRTRMSGARETEYGRFAPPGQPQAQAGVYELEADTLRVGATLRPWAGVELTLDQVVTSGAYREAETAAPLAVELLHLETAAMAAADFGRYVTVRAYARLLRRSYSVATPALDAARWEPRFGGALEFVF